MAAEFIPHHVRVDSNLWASGFRAEQRLVVGLMGRVVRIDRAPLVTIPDIEKVPLVAVEMEQV